PAPPPVVDNVPSFQPQDTTESDDSEAVAPQPSVDLAQSGSHIATRVIQPTGESITPKVDVENLLANEEAKEIMSQPISPDFQSQQPPAPTEAPVASDLPEIQVDSTGAININNLPDTPTPDNTVTFPNQS
ncbi:MAG: hypothetical protein LBQ11_01800, partial [Candidatus Nomurabacteria bacterium]|nr:hypothetical protein [Candidatus Nomurabacteria bacterium]